MKQTLLLVALFASLLLKAQSFSKGQIVVRKFLASSLQDNHAGENPERRISVYLPPGYETAGKSYPVLYYLHGYTWNDSTTVAWLNLRNLMDSAILLGIVRPMIIVVPDSYTLYGGSWYSNSSLTGNWADFIGKDVVTYIDKQFRTIPGRDSRGIAGISMGGNGALRMGMLFPETFGVVYSSSAAILNWSEGINPSISPFRTIANARTEKDVMDEFGAQLMVDLGRTWSPDESKPPFYANMPANFIGDSLVIDLAVVRKWDTCLPFNMIESHLAALKSLNALKMEWGRNDQGRHTPFTNLEFSKKLEHFGVRHFAEEYLGGHSDLISGTNGRFYTDLLPFLNAYLKYR